MIDASWWVQVVELPVVAGLLWLNWQTRTLATATKDGLAEYKVEVAKSYVSIGYMKDVEIRLTDHLKSIEEKLDRIQSARKP